MLRSVQPDRSTPATIVNHSDANPAWRWVSDLVPGFDWRFSSSPGVALPSWMPRRDAVRRLVAARRGIAMLPSSGGVLVTHGPRPAFHAAMAGMLSRKRFRHLAFTFNWTTLPDGARLPLMRRAYRRVDRFVVFSRMERRLYADWFDCDVDRFDMIHWGVRPPEPDPAHSPVVTGGPYVCAIGGQGRDYGTLFEAMRRLPRLRLVVVASRESLRGLSAPDNVVVHVDVPYGLAMNILAHSRFMVLPLAGSRVPCGHVTIVAAMHLGKAVVATDSAGLDDYARPGETALTMAPSDPVACARAIQQLWEAPSEASALGERGASFAASHCTEERTVEYIARWLSRGVSERARA